MSKLVFENVKSLDFFLDIINPLLCFSITSVEHILIEQYENFYGEYIGLDLIDSFHEKNMSLAKEKWLQELLFLVRNTTKTGVNSTSGKHLTTSILIHVFTVYEIQSLKILELKLNYLVKAKILIRWRMISDQSMLRNPPRLKRSGNFLDLQHCLDFSP